MRSVVVDKVASVAQHSELGHELRLSGDIPCEEGVLVAVRVLNNKTRYNQLELTSGRMATVNQGDVVVGALGHRKALRGYSGHLPTSLKPGDTIQLLNIGGVLGICDSANPDVGAPFDCEVLGTVLSFPYLGERIGDPERDAYGLTLRTASPTLAGFRPPASTIPDAICRGMRSQSKVSPVPPGTPGRYASSSRPRPAAYSVCTAARSVSGLTLTARIQGRRCWAQKTALS